MFCLMRREFDGQGNAMFRCLAESEKEKELRLVAEHYIRNGTAVCDLRILEEKPFDVLIIATDKKNEEHPSN